MKLFPPLKALFAIFLIAIFSGNLNAVVVSFQHGADGYSGVQDTYIIRTSPGTITHAQTVVQIRDTMQGLVQFDNIIGNSPSQIPPGATILSAKLTVGIAKSSVNTISLHRVLVPWTGATANWNFFDDGISVADGEAHATADTVFAAGGEVDSPLELDVKASVQAWADGAANNGWVFFSEGTDVFRFHSSENSTVAFRPSLVVEYVTEGPVAILQQPESKVVFVDEYVEFSVFVSGTLPYAFQWQKDGTAISGATNQSYILPRAVLGDAGGYSVVVTNNINSVTSQTANLTVNPQTPLSITAEPQDRTINQGTDVTFTVGISGAAPRFQWYKDQQPIPGATNQSLVVTDAQPFQSGNYHVVATNLLSSVTSSAAALLVIPFAPPPYTILDMHSTWRYNQTGANLGTAWREVDYPAASTWPQGQALLAVENNAVIVPLIRTTLSLGSPQIWTYYFRSTFNLTNDPASVILTASSYIDDGAVFYINGVEVWRYFMPPGGISFNTPATGAAPEGVLIVTNLPTDSLVEGINVIAVEVHQVNLTSSDIVFGTQLGISFPAASELSIIRQPESQTVEEGKTAVFSVGIAGGAPVFQWFKDGQAVPGANRSTYTITNVVSTHGGDYHVVAGNSVNTVVSDVAHLTVIQDTNPPTLLWAIRSQTQTNVTVTFDERVDEATANNRLNYTINIVGSATTVNVVSATITNGTNVILSTGPLNLSSNYVLTVNNVRDASPSLNPILPNSQVLIGFEAVVMPFNAGFAYYEGYNEPDPNWFQPEFNDSHWYGSGGFANDPLPGIFGWAIPAIELPVPVRTGLDLGHNEWSYYFRHRLVTDASMVGARVHLRHAIDDGAIFYMNGVEFFRFNMPDGVISSNTPAASIIGDAQVLGPIEIPSHVLRAGTNVFAAQVHQYATVGGTSVSANDIIFGAELSGIFESRVGGPALITRQPQSMTVMEGDLAMFDFRAAAGISFQWQRSSTNIPGAVEPVYTIPRVRLADDGAVFRVVVVGSTGGITSSNAVLTVIPDTVPPVLLSAYLGSDPSQVLVSFSEPLAPASATTLANYTITNLLGQVRAINSATLVDPSTVMLTMAAPISGSHVLRVRNITDDAVTPNFIQPESGATIGFEAELIPFLSTWRYWQSYGDVGTAWRLPATSDAGAPWASGETVFEARNSFRDTVGGQPVNTVLDWKTPTDIQNRAVYFRKTFDFPADPRLSELELYLFIDDGAVVYLNGQEVYRLGMPTGTITWATLANRTVGTAEREGPFTIPSTALIAGQNVIAVEVHQVNETSSDLTFAMELFGSTPSVQVAGVVPNPCEPEQPELDVSVIGNSLALSWSVAGNCPENTFHLQQTSALEGPATQWVNVPNGNTSPVSIPIQALSTGQFFRLIKP